MRSRPVAALLPAAHQNCRQNEVHRNSPESNPLTSTEFGQAELLLLGCVIFVASTFQNANAFLNFKTPRILYHVKCCCITLVSLCVTEILGSHNVRSHTRQRKHQKSPVGSWKSFATSHHWLQWLDPGLRTMNHRPLANTEPAKRAQTSLCAF